MKRIGLHLRLQESLLDVVHKAVALEVPFFQCFLVSSDNNQLISVTEEQKKEFLTLRRNYFEQLYIHGSYWINLAGLNKQGKRALEYELRLAQELEFTHMVLHPGFVTAANKEDGIDALARILNHVLCRTNITIILENTAHGHMSVGSDINDFALLLQKIDCPEKLFFCIDTAHAFVYGYDFLSPSSLELFGSYLDKTLGLSRIALIHLNDTKKKHGSRIDKHECIGEGIIGEEVLQSFIKYPPFAHVPIILEPPKLTTEQEYALIQKIRMW